MYGSNWTEARQVVLQRDLNRCYICGEQATDPHHRVVQGMGGRKHDEYRHAPEKLVSFCRPHHRRVHNMRSLAADLGYFIRPGEDPLTKPVWAPAEQSWFELTAGGTRLQYPNWRPPEVQIA